MARAGGNPLCKGNKNTGRKKKSEEFDVAMNTKATIEAMKRIRDKAIKMATEKMSQADFRGLTDSIDKMTKNIQLLSDKPTDNIGVIKGIKLIMPDGYRDKTNS